MRGRILRSFSADILGQALNIGIRLILVPLFLSAWGAEAYGEWLILTAIAAWFGLGDLGGQLYFINRLTAEWTAGKLDQFQRTYSTGLSFFLGASIALLLCVLIGLSYLPVADWLAIKSVSHAEVKIILLFMALRFLVALPIGMILGIYRAIGIQATSVMYGNLILLIQFIASAVVLLSGGQMFLLAALEALPFLLILFVVVWDLRRRMPPVFSLFSFDQADREIFRMAILPSLHFLGLQVSAAIIIQGVVLVIARTLGPVEVAMFSSMRIVANVISRFTSVLAHAAWPEITRLATLGQDKELANLFRIVTQATLFIGLCYLCLIVIRGEMLYRWWLNDALEYDFWAMYLLACQVVMNMLWTWGGNVLMATNRHEGYARWQLPVNLFSLLLSYWGADKFGLIGCLAGQFAGQSLPMLMIVVSLLARNGWRPLAHNLAFTSLMAFMLLPASLNLWIALPLNSLLMAMSFWWNRWLANRCHQILES